MIVYYHNLTPKSIAMIKIWGGIIDMSEEYFYFPLLTVAHVMACTFLIEETR